MTNGHVKRMLLLMLVVTATSFHHAAAQAPAAPRQTLAQARPQAIEQILASSHSDDPFLRANAVEAMQAAPDRVLPVVQLALEDDHSAVRFAALVTIGKLKLTSLGDAAVRRVDDESDSVRAAAMYAARMCGRPVNISDMADMLASPDPTLRGNVAMLLGLMGDRSAIPMLEELASVPMPRASAVRQALVRLQVAEALVNLGNDSALDAIRAAAYSAFDEVRVMAVMTMGRLDDRRMEAALLKMVEEPPVELQLAAAEALARMDSAAGLPVMLEAATSEMPTVRAQAAFGLAQVPAARSAGLLQKLLSDPSEQVRLSAAAALLQAAQRQGLSPSAASR